MELAFGVKSKHLNLAALPAGQVTVARAVLPCIPHLASLLRLVLPQECLSLIIQDSAQE